MTQPVRNLISQNAPTPLGTGAFQLQATSASRWL